MATRLNRLDCSVTSSMSSLKSTCQSPVPTASRTTRTTSDGLSPCALGTGAANGSSPEARSPPHWSTTACQHRYQEGHRTQSSNPSPTAEQSLNLVHKFEMCAADYAARPLCKSVGDRGHILTDSPETLLPIFVAETARGLFKAHEELPRHTLERRRDGDPCRRICALLRRK